MYSNTKTRRTDYVTILLKQGRQIFHTQDLGVLWGMGNKNTLYTTIKRYVQKTILYPIQKGLYSTVPVDQLDSWEVGIQMLHTYAYISCESILFKEGYMNQPSNAITVMSHVNEKFSIGDIAYRSRKLPAKFLLNAAGLSRQSNILIATPERAIADELYFNPKANFDWEVKWDHVKNIQNQLGYPLTPQRYGRS